MREIICLIGLCLDRRSWETVSEAEARWAYPQERREVAMLGADRSAVGLSGKHLWTSLWYPVRLMCASCGVGLFWFVSVARMAGQQDYKGRVRCSLTNGRVAGRLWQASEEVFNQSLG